MKIKKINCLKFYLYIVIIFYLSLLLQVKSHTIDQIEIGQEVKGSMHLDESHKYYKLYIPKNESNRVLIISTKEDTTGTLENQDMKDSFSDPDIYISKKNKFPSSRKSSEWFSEQYGSDILSIPSKSVEADDVFYIGMYCQFKCKYFLRVKTGVEIEAKINEKYQLQLKPKETMNYKIKINKDFEKLKVVTYSLTGGKFKIFMNQNSPSSGNTYKVIPSWEKGYVILIDKNSREYCTNCEYHVIIVNEEEEENSGNNLILFYVGTEDEYDFHINLEHSNKIYDVLEENSKKCFSLNITEREKREEKLIINIVLFSGQAILVVEGWRRKSPNSLTKEEGNNNYLYSLIMEKYIILGEKDFDKFDQEENYSYKRNSVLHFCLYSVKQISYSLQAYYLKNLNKLEQNNILMPGYQLRAYLLKDQIITYELYSDNINKLKYNVETNVSIIMNKISGKSNLYGYFCKEENCVLNKKYNLEKLEDKNQLLMPKQDVNPLISTLHIPYKDNYCMNEPVITLNSGNKIKCTTYAIIKCDNPNEESGLCIYDLEFKVKDTDIFMMPKKVYYGQIFMGKSDRYRITISDKNVESLIIVLNSESGDAQLSVYLEDETSYNKKSLISISTHNDYIPDVVKIDNKKLGKQNLIGKYIVNVYPEAFSSYQIYYYVLYNKGSYYYYVNNKGKIPEINMNLFMGPLIVDYFPNDIRYKIYGYTPVSTQKENIKVFINRVNINFDIYIFNDISKFEIEQLYKLNKESNTETIKGYLYKSDTNNEVIIPKKDIILNLNKMIYIIVAPSDPFSLKEKMNNNDNEQISKEELDKKAVSKFYIGITSQNTPLSIKEGMPHIMTLSNSYSHQIYQKMWANSKKDLSLIINVLMGQIDIFASTKYLTDKEIDNIDINEAKYNVQLDTYEFKKIKFKLDIKYFAILELENHFLQEEKTKGYKYVYYYIRRSESMEKNNKTCQYTISEKTTDTKGQILQPGIVTTGKIKVGDKAYFIVEEIEKRKWAYINLIFKKGSGNLYVRIPKIPESHSNIRYPNEGYYDYKGDIIYSGRIISIPDKEFKRLNEKENKLQFLITVTAETGTETIISSDENQKVEIQNQVEFSISYSNEPKRINQNEPYDGYISQGEYQYFNLYFDKSTENIYIGLSNMNGDADMYLNRGNVLPSIEKSDWSSTESGHEYIDIGKDDIYFQNTKKNISGYYTLLIVGFVDTSYSLFVSCHEKKVFPLRDNIPMTCWCEKKGEQCFFRYNNIYDNFNAEKGINHNEVIFTSQYLYGSGFMYSKTFKDKELHNSQDFYKAFPNSTNHEFSNKKSNQLNYMKVKVEGEKYTKDTSILLTFECSSKTKVDITTTSLNHFSSVDYIQENRENIYYLGMNDLTKKIAKLTLIFGNHEKNQDLIYSVHSYVGDAHFKVYGNTSVWDISSQKIVYDYKLLNEFDLITNDKNQDVNVLEVYNPYTHDYHNFISKKDKEKYNDIYFFVEPYNDKNEFGFYIQCNFDKSWNKLQIGKAQTFYVVNQELFGYFDITEEYDNIEFSLIVNNNLKLFAEVYIKINIIDKNEFTQIKRNPEKKEDEFSLYHYSIPSPSNFDYKSVTDKTLGTLSLNLNKLPRLTEQEMEKGNKIIRALFYVSFGDLNFQPIQGSEKKNNYEENDFSTSSDTHTTVNIYISPGKDNFKYMELRPYEYYFSNLTYNTSRYHWRMDIKRPVETKVYSLTIENPQHNLLVIEISVCYGGYRLNLQEELITKDNINKRSIYFSQVYENGKSKLYIENPTSKHYYLSIKPRGYNYFCRRKKIKEEDCGNDLVYLIYYYSTYSGTLLFLNMDKWISYKPYGIGKVELELPMIITKDLEENKKDITDYKFDVFATKRKDYTTSMENICHLSRLTSDKERIFKLESFSLDNNNKIIITELDPRSIYYINILVQNRKTKELLTFAPFEVITGGRRPLFPIFRTIFVILIIIALIIFIYKYSKAKKELIFLKGEAVAKTEKEFDSMKREHYDDHGIQYTSLSSGY